jgi:hypothetical protein
MALAKQWLSSDYVGIATDRNTAEGVFYMTHAEM